MQLIYRPDNGEILGVHIFGLHAADLIHEASNAIALGTCIQVFFFFPPFAHTICKTVIPNPLYIYGMIHYVLAHTIQNIMVAIFLPFIIFHNPCTLQDIKFAVHAHPTLSEVLDELFKSAKVTSSFPL